MDLLDDPAEHPGGERAEHDVAQFTVARPIGDREHPPAGGVLAPEQHVQHGAARRAQPRGVGVGRDHVDISRYHPEAGAVLAALVPVDGIVVTHLGPEHVRVVAHERRRVGEVERAGTGRGRTHRQNLPYGIRRSGGEVVTARIVTSLGRAAGASGSVLSEWMPIRLPGGRLELEHQSGRGGGHVHNRSSRYRMRISAVHTSAAGRPSQPRRRCPQPKPRRGPPWLSGATASPVVR